jgi:hypothetical protein
MLSGGGIEISQLSDEDKDGSNPGLQRKGQLEGSGLLLSPTGPRSVNRKPSMSMKKKNINSSSSIPEKRTTMKHDINRVIIKEEFTPRESDRSDGGSRSKPRGG